jgi:hypothetical protein
MLILTRGLGQEIVIDHRIRVRVVAVVGQEVRIGVCAPDSISVDPDVSDGHERDAAGYPPLTSLQAEFRR